MLRQILCLTTVVLYFKSGTLSFTVEKHSNIQNFWQVKQCKMDSFTRSAANSKYSCRGTLCINSFNIWRITGVEFNTFTDLSAGSVYVCWRMKIITSSAFLTTADMSGFQIVTASSHTANNIESQRCFMYKQFQYLNYHRCKVWLLR